MNWRIQREVERSGEALAQCMGDGCELRLRRARHHARVRQRDCAPSFIPQGSALVRQGQYVDQAAQIAGERRAAVLQHVAGATVLALPSSLRPDAVIS